MTAIPVVRIVWPANAAYGGFVEINETDFDPATHERWFDPLDRDRDGHRGGSKKKAPEVDPLDIPHEDAGGLTLRELHADAEALGIEIDPLGLVSDLFAKVQAAKAAKAADAAPEAGGGPAPADAPAVEGGETQTPASDA